MLADGQVQLLGGRIRRFREVKGLSQTELEKKTGIKREYLSKIENDELKNPTYFTLWKISEGLGVPVSDLVGNPDGVVARHEPVIQVVSALKKDKHLQEDIEAGKYVAVPIIDEAIAAGNPTYINEKNIQDYALIFSGYIKPSTDYFRYRCVWVQKGSTSMSPVIEPGALVCIDSYQRDPKLLEGMIVAMKDNNDGCTLRYLKLIKDYIMGIPENIKEHDPLIFSLNEKRTEKNPVIGKVVWYWIVVEE